MIAEPDRWGVFDCPDCGAPCHVEWDECGSCDRSLSDIGGSADDE